MHPHRFLITGKTGQLGHVLQTYLAPLGQVIALGREALDLSQPRQIAAVIAEIRPTWIINPAAYTAVDKAESERALVYAINADALGALAQAAKQCGAGIVHYSTDYVFDGAHHTPYTETDTPQPLNVYGASKLAGEQQLAESGVPHLILRTSWVYGAYGNNFVKTLQRLLTTRADVSVVADQIGAPTSSTALAELTARLLLEIGLPQQLQDRQGVYHATCQGQTSWFGLASAIRTALAVDPTRTLATLHAIPSADYPTPAQRSAYSVLDNHKLHATFGMQLPDWATAFAAEWARFDVMG